MREKRDNRRGELGIVSIMVTMIMIIVISLIVLGFAEIARNEQRSSLDQELSVQAFYAAESGINDARAAIQGMISSGNPVQSKTLCGNQGGYTLNSTIDSNHNVSYSCVLVNPTPSALSFDIGYTSTVEPIISGTGAAFGKLNLSWLSPAGSTSPAGCFTSLASPPQLPIAAGPGQWACDYPIVRVDLLDANGALARANWNAATSTIFFVPLNTFSGNNNVVLGSRGIASPAFCNNATCTANIVGVGGTTYYMRVTTLYRTNFRLTVSSGGGKTFSSAQATIDSTGKAQDVLRRILVAIDLTDANTSKNPSGALVVEDSICKRFGTANNAFDVYDDLTVGGGGNRLCIQQANGSPTP